MQQTNMTFVKELSKIIPRCLSTSSKMSAKIEILPKYSLADERLTSTILEDLKPHQTVSLRLNVSNQVNLNYSTLVYFQANSDGQINLATDSPRCESYDKPDLMAIHWLMKPQEKSDSRFWPSKVENGLRCLYQVFDKENNKLAEEVVYKNFMSEGVERIELKDDGFVGTLFLPPGEGPFPAVINMYGGIYRGTVVEDRSAMLASRGIASLALAYFGVPGLPKSYIDVPMHLEYYEGAVDYLMNHPKIYSKRGIGISGVSKGGENALAMAAFLSPAKIGAVIVLNTSIQSTICPVMYKNETLLEGYSPSIDITSFHYVTPTLINLSKLKIGLDGDKFIPIQKSLAPIRFVVAADDQFVPSLECALIAEKLMKENNKSNYEIHSYPGLGHLIDCPYAPPTLTSNHPLFPKPFQIEMGGSNILQHGKAQEKIWNETISFFKEHLCHQY